MFFIRGDIKNPKNLLFLGFIITIITLLINLIVFKFLPESIALQTNGGNQIPRGIFLFIIPSIMVIVNFINIKLNNRGMINAVATNILCLVVDILVILMNVM